MKSNCRGLRAFTKAGGTCETRMTRGTCVFVKRLELRALKNACTKLFIICQSTDIDDLMARHFENSSRCFLKPLSYTSHASYTSHLHFASRETPLTTNDYPLTPNP